jgi:hypothetical protein
MIGKPVIFFFVQQKFLPVVSFLDALNMIRRIVITDAGTMYGEIILLVPDILAINGIEVTLAERKVMNGIQKVGFPDPVIPDKTVDLIRKLVISL